MIKIFSKLQDSVQVDFGDKTATSYVQPTVRQAVVVTRLNIAAVMQTMAIVITAKQGFSVIPVTVSNIFHFYIITSANSGEGYVFSRFCMFVCRLSFVVLSFYLFVCLCPK